MGGEKESGMVADAIPLGGTAIKPVGWDRSGMEAFRYMMYNPDTGEVLSRTPMSWLKIIVFYCIYYSCLAAFWIGCLQVFFLTLPVDEPRWTLDGSIIGTNPGVGVKPSQADSRIDSSMFTLDIADTSKTPTNDVGEGEKNFDYAKRMEIFMTKNSNATGLSKCTGTDYNGACIFDTTTLGECEQSPYGFMPVDGNVQPCLFLKLNKIWAWEPKGVKVAELDDPKYADMTDTLKQKIKADGGDQASHVYMDCKGRFPADTQDVTLTYYPENQGLPLRYFPFKGGNYQSPMVAVKVAGTNLGQLLHIECRAWFDEVVHSSKDKLGLIQFEVYITNSEEK